MEESKEFIKKILAIVGHTPDEQEKYSNNLINLILQSSALDISVIVPNEISQVFLTKLNTGQSPNEIFLWLNSYIDNKSLQAILTNASQRIMKKYFSELLPELSKQQQEQIVSLLRMP